MGHNADDFDGSNELFNRTKERDDARRERDEARSEVAAQSADLMNATTRERQYEERIAQLEAENAALKAGVERLELNADQEQRDLVELVNVRKAEADAWVAENAALALRNSDLKRKMEELRERAEAAEAKVRETKAIAIEALMFYATGRKDLVSLAIAKLAAEGTK